jgi:hypothetical protein
MALVAAAAIAVIVIARADGGPAPGERPAAVPAAPALAALAAAESRLQAVVGKRHGRFVRHSRALFAVLREPGLGGTASAAARLRADVLRVQTRVRATKPRGKRAKRARRLVLKSQAAAIAGLEDIRRFALGSAVTDLDRAAKSLGSAKRLARRGSRQLGCRRPCGNGF